MQGRRGESDAGDVSRAGLKHPARLLFDLSACDRRNGFIEDRSAEAGAAGGPAQHSHRIRSAVLGTLRERVPAVLGPGAGGRSRESRRVPGLVPYPRQPQRPRAPAGHRSAESVPGSAVGFHVAGAALAGGPHRYRAALPGFPRRGCAQRTAGRAGAAGRRPGLPGRLQLRGLQRRLPAAAAADGVRACQTLGEMGERSRVATQPAAAPHQHIPRMNALAIYDELTAGRSRFVRIDELCACAAEAEPGLLPGRQELEAEANLPLRDKKGLEKAQGEFLSRVLADRARGAHLCHAMLLPRQESIALLPEFENTGQADLNGARIERHGKASIVTMRNPRYLNAEDESTLDGMEMAVDLALLDPKTEVCVLRGGAVEHPKFAGRRLFGAGIARQAILAERRIDCASAEGRMICDEIVPAQGMDEAISKIVNKLPGSGVVSAAGNRRAFRAGEEPLDLFRRYMAVYAREQAYCHFSPALIANLEKNWKIR